MFIKLFLFYYRIELPLDHKVRLPLFRTHFKGILSHNHDEY